MVCPDEVWLIRMCSANLRSYATPPMLLALSLKTGFVYAAFSVPICILLWLYLPETKG